MACRVVFQMDQVAHMNQVVLWHQLERDQDANLDRCLQIRAISH